MVKILTVEPKYVFIFHDAQPQVITRYGQVNIRPLANSLEGHIVPPPPRLQYIVPLLNASAQTSQDSLAGPAKNTFCLIGLQCSSVCSNTEPEQLWLFIFRVSKC